MDQTAEFRTACAAEITGEIRPLTGLRIVAAVWVVLFHFRPMLGDVTGFATPRAGGALGCRPLLHPQWARADLNCPTAWVVGPCQPALLVAAAGQVYGTWSPALRPPWVILRCTSVTCRLRRQPADRDQPCAPDLVSCGFSRISMDSVGMDRPGRSVRNGWPTCCSVCSFWSSFRMKHATRARGPDVAGLRKRRAPVEPLLASGQFYTPWSWLPRTTLFAERWRAVRRLRPTDRARRASPGIFRAEHVDCRNPLPVARIRSPGSRTAAGGRCRSFRLVIAWRLRRQPAGVVADVSWFLWQIRFALHAHELVYRLGWAVQQYELALQDQPRKRERRHLLAIALGLRGCITSQATGPPMDAPMVDVKAASARSEPGSR